MKRIILSVTNDLFSDQRVDKVCNTLTKMGFHVTLVGRRYRNSPKLSPRNYQTKRLHLLFKTGPLFYAEFNLRLFFYLLFKKVDILVANDLDTLLPNVLIKKLRNKKLVYDAHEYFCGILEIQHRPRVKKIWQRIEKYCFPKTNAVITVSQSIADKYREEYGKEVAVVRNIPVLGAVCDTVGAQNFAPNEKPVIILQGNAIHKNRGGEEIIEAMPFIRNAVLLIVGQGDMIPYMKGRVKELNLQERVTFTGRVTPDKLRTYTASADLGIAFDKNVSPNHFYSLPNKLFEYIHAGVPVISSDLPERKRIIEQYETGVVLSDLEPQTVANAINSILENSELLIRLKENCRTATQELNWENEERMIWKIYCITRLSGVVQ
ncbi:MAG: glycosyltransferase family 4 protein [Bacteroidetes bacterium]|nr:glycosyltransferase family 4 protein [Bacteroidota bacterium]MCL2302710.1 glycosyltransferase family 4 protein [Lentimicrobiaceae bacterium]